MFGRLCRPDTSGSCNQRLQLQNFSCFPKENFLDFADLKKIVKAKVLDRLDHRNLDEIIENPTAENVAEWIKEQLREEIPLKSIKLWVGKWKWVEG